MYIKIKETGELNELYIAHEGTEWTQGLIGNTGALKDGQFVWSEEENAYVTSQDNYDWWAKYIADTKDTSADVTTND